MASNKSTALVAAILLVNILCVQSKYISYPGYAGYQVITERTDNHALDSILPLLIFACTGRGGLGFNGCGCNGGCNGSCNGSCNGGCSGSCNGGCNGGCSGSCSGNCGGNSGYSGNCGCSGSCGNCGCSNSCGGCGGCGSCGGC